MRILHVIASLSPVHGGTTSAVLQMIAGLEALGVACEVAASDDDGPGRRLADDAPERNLPGRHYFPKHRDFYVHTPTMGPWLDAHVDDYDLVHIHGLFSHVNGLAGRICHRRGVPYVVTPHGMANRYGMRHKPWRKKLSFLLVERALLEGAAAVHMTSHGEERDFAALKIETPVVRIPLVVAPIARGDSATFRARQPETGSRLVAVFMGRLNPIKNLEAAIDALALPGGNGFHLMVCGHGPADYAQELKARATQRNVADQISWLGFISGQQKADVLAAGDVYVQPSLSESFGMAAVEAVSAGVPCVLSENVAIEEELVAAGFAISAPPTAEAFANALIKAVFMKKNSPDYEVRARNFVTSKFSRGSLSLDLMNLYKRASGRSAQRDT